jgi:hypothetical protein
MSAAITEPAPQAAISPPAAAIAPAAGADRPVDTFMAMLAAVLDTKIPPPVAAADPAAASPPKIEGPAILPIVTAPARPAGVAPVPQGFIKPLAVTPLATTPLSVPPPVIAASPPADLTSQAIPATLSAKLSTTKPAMPMAKSSTTEADPAPDIVLPTSAMPPVWSPVILPSPDPAGAEVKPTAPVAIVSAPATAPAAPPQPPPAEAVGTAPPPAEDPAKPHDRIANDPIISIPDRLPDATAAPTPQAVPAHNAPAPEAIPVHVAAVLPGAPPVQPIAPQVGAAFVVLARAGDGTHHLTLLLQPPDLGELRIAVEQSRDGPPKIAVTAANPSTLLILLRDQSALNKALDSAGIIGDGRVVTFHLAPASALTPVAAASSAQNPGDAAQSQTGGQNAEMSGQSPPTQSGTGGGGGQGQRPARHEPPAPAWFADMTQMELTPTRQTLAGIDITA